MSNASLKEQLQAVASQLGEKVDKPVPAHHKKQALEKNKKTKPRWLDYVQYGVELLRVYFPAGFKSGNAIQPLKKGIKQELVKRLSTMSEIVIEDKACMVKSLAYYVNTAAYHKSVTIGATRIDLDGNAAGIVTAEEAQYSIERHQAKAQGKVPSTQKGQVTEEVAQP